MPRTGCKDGMSLFRPLRESRSLPGLSRRSRAGKPGRLVYERVAVPGWGRGVVSKPRKRQRNRGFVGTRIWRAAIGLIAHEAGDGLPLERFPVAGSEVGTVETVSRMIFGRREGLLGKR